MTRKTPFKSKGRRTVIGLAAHKTEVALMQRATDKLLQERSDLLDDIESLKAATQNMKQDHSEVMMGLHKDLHEAQQDLAITKRERDAVQASKDLHAEFVKDQSQRLKRDRLTINALIGYKEA